MIPSSDETMTDHDLDLEFRLASAQDSRGKYDVITAMVEQLRYRDYDRALRLVDDMHSIGAVLAGGSAEDQINVGMGLKLSGSVYVQGGHYDKGLQAYNEAYTLFIRLKVNTEVAEILAEVSRVHLYQSGYVNALQYTLDGLELARELADDGIQARLLTNMSALYIAREEYTRALSYLLKAKKICEDRGQTRTLIEVLDQICQVYVGLGNTEPALEAGNQGLQMARETGVPPGEACVLIGLGSAYRLSGDRIRAMDHLQKALYLARQLHLRYDIIRALLNLAGVHFDDGEYQEALPLLEEGLQISEEIRARGKQVECHQALSNLYRRMDQFQNALLHYENLHETQLQLTDDESESRIRNLEVMYQVEQVKREAEKEQEKNLILQKEIQERIETQRLLQEANERLQKEIIIREQLISDLNAFARMVAHDLKTPLQSIAILAHLLESHLKDSPNNTEVLSLVHQVQQTGQKSAAIVHELLTLAGLRNQEVSVQPLQMENVLKEVFQRISFLIEESGARISHPAEWPQVYGYAPWVEEIWSNYLTNAIKYGGYPPVISLGAMVEDGGFIRFWVQDNGNGIDPEYQSRLFNAFTRLDSARVEGHGLGLSIVQRIAEKLGGKVGVDSRGRPGEGSRFWFSLPAVN